MINNWSLFLSSYGVLGEIGSEPWWEAIRSVGMPLIQTLDEENCLVVFIWQDPQGNEKTSSVASVILDVNSLTNHHSWEPICLSRLAGTDAWFGQLTVSSQWRGSYSFIPLQANQLPDIALKNSDGSREAQRAWWIDVASNQIPDDLNTLPTQVSGWGESSPLHLPNAPIELGWKEWEQGNLDTVPTSQIHSISWQSSSLENKRICSVYSTAMGDAPLVILLDGQQWGAVSGTLSVLQYLTETKRFSPAHYLLIPCINGQTRWKELSCHRPFWQALIDELLPTVKHALSTSDSDISEMIVAGQSLGGLSALYAGLTFPEHFSKVISLSGSFWWPEENRVNGLVPKQPLENLLPKGGLAEQVVEGRLSIQHLNIFMTVGSGEKDMCLYNQMMYEAIKGKNGNVHFETVHGGHDRLSWRSGLVNGLLHLIPA